MLMKLLGYAKYQRFQNTINKAKVSCANGEESVESHFFILGKMVERAQDGGREQEDYRLSRYACCLIAQNGDPRKEQIASAQKYFVIEPIWDLRRSHSQPLEHKPDKTLVEFSGCIMKVALLRF